MILEEKRRFPRYDAPESLAAVARFSSNREQRLRMKKISIDGFSFVTKMDIAGETFFTLSLEMTGSNNRLTRINTAAKIIWCTYDKEASLYTAGAQFLGLKEAEKELFERMLASLKPEKER